LLPLCIYVTDFCQHSSTQFGLDLHELVSYQLFEPRFIRECPCYRILYRGPPFEISLCNQSTMSFCQNCGKEIQSEWIRCPFCPTQPSQTKTLGKQISYALGSCILIFSLYVLFTSKYFEDALFWMIAPMGIGSAIILNAMMK